MDVLDAIREITNIIVGSFKNAMEAEIGGMGLTVPTVVFGHNFTAGMTHQTAD
jgi:CheY-specific phosphatase CheX